jgi:thiol-disulfide isomerase/thioredoxin
LVLSLLVAFNIAGKIEASSISGNITFPDGRYQDSLAIELSAYLSLKYVNPPLYQLKQSKTDFSFDVEPGKYTLLIYSFGCENFRKDLVLVDNDSHIKLDITIPKKGINKDIKIVRINGAFTNWDGTKGIEMKKTGGVWKLEDTSILKVGDSYEFILDDDPHEVIDIKNDNIEYTDMYGYQCYYIGGEIIFDPSLYTDGSKLPSATVSGSDIQEEFEYLLLSLDEIDRDLGNELAVLEQAPFEEWEKIYSSKTKQLNDLLEITTPSLQQMILEKYLRVVMFYHPNMFKLRELYEDGYPSPVKVNEYLKSDLFKDYYETSLELLNQLDPNSFILEDEFTGTLFNIQFLADSYPILAQTYAVDENFAYNFLMDFINESPNKLICGRLLYFYANQLTYMDDDEKAIYLSKMLLEKYPDHELVKDGSAQALLDGMKVTVGYKAPDFSVQTIPGDSLTLSSFRGKFVFIDFWGTWCGPCIGELPNLKNMAALIPSEKIQIIGLAQDNFENLSAYLEIDPLPYPNALLPETVQKAYGIKAYPTTFLIDPEGMIIGKNLRGHDLAGLVNEKIEAYKK